MQEEAKQDLKFNQDLLENDSLNIPNLHAKWFDYYMREKSALHKRNAELRIMLKDKHEYYHGIGNNVHPAKVLRQDLDKYVEADAECIEVKSKYEWQKLKVEYVEGVLKMIANRGFQIKSAVDFIKFKHGA